MQLRLESINVDKVVGRCAGQFDLDERALALLGIEQHAVIVVIAKVGELSVKSNSRTGERTLMQVLTPLDVHVASNGLREQLIAAMNHDEQLSFEYDEPTEDDLEPPDDVETYSVVPGTDFTLTDRAPDPEPREPEPREAPRALNPPPLPADDVGDSVRVLGHVRGERKRKDKVLQRFMETVQ